MSNAKLIDLDLTTLTSKMAYDHTAELFQTKNMVRREEAKNEDVQNTCRQPLIFRKKSET